MIIDFILRWRNWLAHLPDTQGVDGLSLSSASGSQTMFAHPSGQNYWRHSSLGESVGLKHQRVGFDSHVATM